LDVSNQQQAIALVESLPDVKFWKVGLELFVSTGSEILTRLKSQNKRIFLDLKFHDIPNTMAGATRAAASYGVDLITVHATAGRNALKAASLAAQEGSEAAGCPPAKLIAITLLTSLTSRELAFDLKFPWNTRICPLDGTSSARDRFKRGGLFSSRSGTIASDLWR
jgi:orotidine-5'-phosphate decarboxylase